MDDGLIPLIEMNEDVWRRFKDSLSDVSAEEADWRPLPQANSINVIVRHLRIEGHWHTDSIERGEPMPSELTPAVQQFIDSKPLDFKRNMKDLEECYLRFIAALRLTTLEELKRLTAVVYGAPAWQQTSEGAGGRTHLLGFHQAIHLAGHGAQVRTIRNLYKKVRGEPGRFFPDNPTYPSA